MRSIGASNTDDIRTLELLKNATERRVQIVQNKVVEIVRSAAIVRRTVSSISARCLETVYQGGWLTATMRRGIPDTLVLQSCLPIIFYAR